MNKVGTCHLLSACGMLLFIHEEEIELLTRVVAYTKCDQVHAILSPF